MSCLKVRYQLHNVRTTVSSKTGYLSVKYKDVKISEQLQMNNFAYTLAQTSGVLILNVQRKGTLNTYITKYKDLGMLILMIC